MNLKKYIRLKNENTKKPSCAEENKERYLQLLAQVQANEAAAASVKRPVKMWVGLATLFSVIAAFIITMSVIFAPKRPIDIYYSEEDINNIYSTYSDVNNDTKKFRLDLDAETIDQVSLFYDTKSGDKLYYTLEVGFESDMAKFVVKINNNYNYKFELNTTINNISLPDYSMVYCKIGRRGEPFIKYKGYIEQSEETVYFEYTQTPALGDEAFFDSIQAIINIK